MQRNLCFRNKETKRKQEAESAGGAQMFDIVLDCKGIRR
jgi:hypothetical protein